MDSSAAFLNVEKSQSGEARLCRTFFKKFARFSQGELGRRLPGGDEAWPGHDHPVYLGFQLSISDLDLSVDNEKPIAEVFGYFKVWFAFSHQQFPFLLPVQ